MLLVPTLKSLNNDKANEVRRLAFVHFLLEREDLMVEDWGDYSQEILKDFAQKLPSDPNYWLSKSTPSGMASRPVATTSLVFNWDRYDTAKKQALLNSVAQTYD